MKISTHNFSRVIRKILGSHSGNISLCLPCCAHLALMRLRSQNSDTKCCLCEFTQGFEPYVPTPSVPKISISPLRRFRFPAHRTSDYLVDCSSGSLTILYESPSYRKLLFNLANLGNYHSCLPVVYFICFLVSQIAHTHEVQHWHNISVHTRDIIAVPDLDVDPIRLRCDNHSPYT